MALTSLLRTMWPDDFVDERDGRFINDRVHANIQRDGTFSVVPADVGRGHHADQLRRIADVADKHDDPDDQAHRRAADRPARRAQGEAAGGLGRPRHALGLGLRQELPHREDLRRHRLLPLRPRRLHQARHRHRGALQGHREPGEDEARRAGCPRNCAESMVKDVGLVAVEDDRWQIYVGGAAGATIRKGDVLATVDSPRRGADDHRARSCSTTARTRTGSSAPTTSCRGWGSTTSRP